MKNKKLKLISSIFLTLTLVSYSTFNCFAASNTFVSSDEVKTAYSYLESTLADLESIGIDLQDASALYALSAYGTTDGMPVISKCIKRSYLTD